MKYSLWPLLLVLAACGAPQVRNNLESTEVSAGASVALLPVNMQQPLEAEVFANLVKFAGTAGRLAAFKGEETRQRRLRQLIADADYDYKADLLESAQQRLAAAGINLERAAFRRSIDNVLGAVPPGRFEKRPPKDTGKDFVLDITVDRWGYFAEGAGDPYLPTVHVGARLLKGDSLEEVYRTRIEYHPLKADPATVSLTADTRFGFDSTEAMTEDPGRTVDGMRTAIAAVVDQLVSDLAALAGR